MNGIFYFYFFVTTKENLSVFNTGIKLSTHYNAYAHTRDNRAQKTYLSRENRTKCFAYLSKQNFEVAKIKIKLSPRVSIRFCSYERAVSSIRVTSENRIRKLLKPTKRI